MAELSSSCAERSRKAYSAVLRATQDAGTQRNVAIAMGVSDSTVSRIKTEKLEDAIALLYQLGFKVVEQSRVCVDRDTYHALSTIASKAMAQPDMARKLIWEEE